MKNFFKILEDGFAGLGQGFLNIFGSWNYKPKKKINYKKIDVNKVIGRDLSDPYSGFKIDNQKLRQDWNKVLGKFK